MHADGAPLLNDRTMIYYSRELAVEYTKRHLNEITGIIVSKPHDVKYLRVSNNPSYQNESREYAGLLNIHGGPWCQVNIARIRELNSPEEESLFHERPISPRVDMERIRQWLTTCDDNHSRCNNPPRTARSPLWLVNVHSGMLVKKHPIRCRYAALSFCHGGKNRFCLSRKNYSRLFTKGFISRDNEKIPRTIRDAITVTAALGLDYLWVDILCKQRRVSTGVAENGSSSNPYLEAYGNSYITLVATGQNAHCGLYGIGLSRRKPQLKEIYHDLTLAVARESFDDILHQSAWNCRRWTFEEARESKRLLIFTVEQVFLSCRQSLWAEGAWLEGYNDGRVENVRHYSIPKPHWRRPDDEPLTDDNFEAYMKLVHDYSQRVSFKPADNVRGFQSFSSSPSFINHQGPLFYGLPTNKFAEALCFEIDGSMRHESEREGVPSWPWLSWKPSGVFYHWPPVTLGSISFYRLETGSQNTEEIWRWIPIDPTSKLNPILYRPPIMAEKIDGTIAAFKAPTINVRFLRRNDENLGILALPWPPFWDVLSADERKFEMTATLSLDSKTRIGEEIKSLLMLLDYHGETPYFKLLLIEKGPTGVFRRVGLSEAHESRLEKANLFNLISYEDIFIY